MVFKITPPQITEELFVQLYDQHAEQMLTIAFSMTNDEETSKEIVQEVFESFWERKDRLQIKGQIKNYLFRAVKLEVIDYYRKRATRTTHLQNEKLFLKGSSPNYTEEMVLYNELNTTIKNLVDTLPRQCREVYKLSREKGLKNKEIAQTVLISEKTVESHLTKALKFLRKNIVTNHSYNT